MQKSVAVFVQLVYGVFGGVQKGQHGERICEGIKVVVAYFAAGQHWAVFYFN